MAWIMALLFVFLLAASIIWIFFVLTDGKRREENQRFRGEERILRHMVKK